MTGSQGPPPATTSTTAAADRSRHWRVVTLAVASVSAVVLLAGGTAGPALLASLGMLVAAGHLVVARPWQRPDPDREEEHR